MKALRMLYKHKLNGTEIDFCAVISYFNLENCFSCFKTKIVLKKIMHCGRIKVLHKTKYNYISCECFSS